MPALEHAANKLFSDIFFLRSSVERSGSFQSVESASNCLSAGSRLGRVAWTCFRGSPFFSRVLLTHFCSICSGFLGGLAPAGSWCRSRLSMSEGCSFATSGSVAWRKAQKSAVWSYFSLSLCPSWPLHSISFFVCPTSAARCAKRKPRTGSKYGPQTASSGCGRVDPWHRQPSAARYTRPRRLLMGAESRSAVCRPKDPGLPVGDRRGGRFSCQTG